MLKLLIKVRRELSAYIFTKPKNQEPVLQLMSLILCFTVTQVTLKINWLIIVTLERLNILIVDHL